MRGATVFKKSPNSNINKSLPLLSLRKAVSGGDKSDFYDALRVCGDIWAIMVALLGSH